MTSRAGVPEAVTGTRPGAELEARLAELVCLNDVAGPRAREELAAGRVQIEAPSSRRAWARSTTSGWRAIPRARRRWITSRL